MANSPIFCVVIPKKKVITFFGKKILHNLVCAKIFFFSYKIAYKSIKMTYKTLKMSYFSKISESYKNVRTE